MDFLGISCLALLTMFRGTETEEQVQKPLRNARAELEQGKSSGLFDHILVNDNLETCYANLKKTLNLNGSSDDACQPSKCIELPAGYSVSEMDQKVLIHCGTNEEGNASNSLYVFDASLLKGGAPGRTRGLNAYAIDPFTEGLNGLKQEFLNGESLPKSFMPRLTRV